MFDLKFGRDTGSRCQPAAGGGLVLGAVLLLWLLVSVAGGPGAPVSAQGPDELYVPETGHVVGEPYLSFYRRVEDPDELYGKPITEPFESAEFGGAEVQYFEKAVLQRNPDPAAPPALRVTAADLGFRLYTPGEEIPLAPGSPGCRVFPETGYQVCYDFLDYFEKQGGAARFGFPISNLEIQDSLFVQYFQRARLEFRPARARGRQVVVSDLGRRYFEGRENPRLLLPVEDGNLPQVILDLHTRAFARRPVAGLEDGQAVYVLVKDQNGLPVEGARVTVFVRFPNRAEQALPGEVQTDSRGIAVVPFTYGVEETGLAVVRVVTSYEDRSDETVASFRIWY